MPCDFSSPLQPAHMNPHFYWCGACWDWVSDCPHCVEPLGCKRQRVEDLWIRSLCYELHRGRLEIEFTWTDDVRQFYPVSPQLYRQLLGSKPMYSFLDQHIFKTRWIRAEYVRTDTKRAVAMAKM